MPRERRATVRGPPGRSIAALAIAGTGSCRLPRMGCQAQVGLAGPGSRYLSKSAVGRGWVRCAATRSVCAEPLVNVLTSPPSDEVGCPEEDLGSGMRVAAPAVVALLAAGCGGSSDGGSAPTTTTTQSGRGDLGDATEAATGEPQGRDRRTYLDHPGER
jgi:hypothetical protein